MTDPTSPAFEFTDLLHMFTKDAMDFCYNNFDSIYDDRYNDADNFYGVVSTLIRIKNLEMAVILGSAKDPEHKERLESFMQLGSIRKLISQHAAAVHYINKLVTKEELLLINPDLTEEMIDSFEAKKATENMDIADAVTLFNESLNQINKSKIN